MRAKVTTGGQVSIPAPVRKRWRTRVVDIQDRGESVVITPAPEDPIAAARGSLEGKIKHSSKQLRAMARADELSAESHKQRGRGRR